ncbi:MAG TPA: hypothetical protein DIU07_15255 [Rhodobacteraceae bacterium]|nr:hypothetical protein [Paracoccaceae bacterium]
MVTTTGTYEGKTMQVTWDIVSPYTATATDEMIQGYGGADTIYGNGLDNYIFGDQRGDKGDFDLAADGADTLYGLGGDDTIDPGAGAGNYVNGGIGNDTLDYRYATPGQTVTIDMELNSASAGTYGSTSFFQIENILGSLNGPNVIYGDEKDNAIHGGSAKDVLKGRDGDDTIYGYDGADKLKGGTGDDRLKGGTGNDSVIGGKGADLLIGGAGDDKIDGGKGSDILVGAKGEDRLFGKEGNDTIDGRKGKDELYAGSGSDKLTGGEGADRFVFFGSSGDNTITDFEAKDTISIGSGANNYFQLKFTDTKAGLRIEFGKAEVFLKGLDMKDIDLGNFDFF